MSNIGKCTFLAVVISVMMCAALAMSGCISSSGSDDSSDGGDSGGSGGGGGTTTTHQYVIIPNASWYTGTATYNTVPGSTAPTATLKSGSSILTVGQTTVWEVNFEAIVEVEAEVSFVLVTSSDLDGYFTYPISAEDVANGYVDIEVELETSTPTEAVCNRDYRGNGTCYEEADTGMTTADFAVANDSSGTFMLTMEAEVGFVISETDTEDSDDGGSGGGGSSGSTVCSGWTSMCSCSLRACSDGTNAWYDVESGVYYCAAINDCTAAAQNAADYCSYGCD